MAGNTLDVPVLDGVDDAALGRVLREAANVLLTESQLSFIGARTPSGAAWPALSPETIKRRRKGSDSPLRDTGRLMNSLLSSDPYQAAEGLAVDVGSNVEYSALQNFGGMAGRGRKVYVPSRQFLVDPDYLPDHVAADLLDIAARAIAESVSP